MYILILYFNISKKYKGERTNVKDSQNTSKLLKKR